MSTLIGLGGKLRAGKDAVGDYLAERHAFTKIGMSDPLNAALLALNPWIPLSPTAMVRYQQLHDHVGYVEAKTNPEVRRLLQALGTEVGRDMLGQDVWVHIAERNIRELLDNGHNVVITAVRFPNELEMIQRLRGTSVWIERASEARGAAEEHSGHASENSVSLEDFEIVIDNDRELRDLYSEVEGLLTELIDVQEQAELRIGPRVLGDDYQGWPNYDR